MIIIYILPNPNKKKKKRKCQSFDDNLVLTKVFNFLSRKFEYA